MKTLGSYILLSKAEIEAVRQAAVRLAAEETQLPADEDGEDEDWLAAAVPDEPALCLVTGKLLRAGFKEDNAGGLDRPIRCVRMNA